MLTQAQREEFDERGFVRLAGAFPADAAAAMEDRVWSALDSRFGVSRADRSSWKLPLGLSVARSATLSDEAEDEAAVVERGTRKPHCKRFEKATAP